MNMDKKDLSCNLNGSSHSSTIKNLWFAEFQQAYKISLTFKDCVQRMRIGTMTWTQCETPMAIWTTQQLLN
jgi:hypothetical protein